METSNNTANLNWSVKAIAFIDFSMSFHTSRAISFSRNELSRGDGKEPRSCLRQASSLSHFEVFHDNGQKLLTVSYLDSISCLHCLGPSSFNAKFFQRWSQSGSGFL